MWVGDTIYFLSDRNGPVTLFAYDTRSHEVKQLVKNDALDFKSASAGTDAIVYEQFGALHLLDLKSGQERPLEINVAADLAEVRPHFQKIEPRRIRSAGISPTGARAVFAARGEILTVPAEKGDIRNLTKTTDVVERDPAWSPDGKSIAYLSDESGEWALHVRDQNGLGEARKIDLGNSSHLLLLPAVVAGFKEDCLHRQAAERLVRRPRKEDAGARGYRHVRRSVDSLDPVWSPDSRWIAYTKQLRNHLHAVFAYSLEQGKTYQLTDGMSDALYAAFDKDGKYLYFTASTDTALSTGWLDMSSLQRPVTRSVYVMVLKKDVASPLAPESDEEKAKRRENRQRQEGRRGQG